MCASLIVIFLSIKPNILSQSTQGSGLGQASPGREVLKLAIFSCRSYSFPPFLVMYMLGCKCPLIVYFDTYHHVIASQFPLFRILYVPGMP